MNIDQMSKTEDSVQKKKNPIDVALKHLSNRDRTCQEIRKVLSEKEYSTEEIENTINYLLGMNYLNDESYVEKYIEYAVSKGKGRAKIKVELRNKGVDKELIDDMISCSEPLELQNERERAFAHALKIMETVKMGDISNYDDDFYGNVQKYKDLQKIKAKIARRLQSLGYSMDVILGTINEVFNE